MKPTLVVLFLSSFCINLYAQSTILSNPSDCNLNLSITDNQCPDGSLFFNPNLFGIEVKNVAGTSLGTDVYLREVRLIISHEWAGDLEVRLISPGGREVLLTDDVGGSTDNYGNPRFGICSEYIRLTDEACVFINDEEQASPPFVDQEYRPLQAFRNFNDSITNPNGIWMLSICDDVEADTGQLEFVELVFEPIACLPVADVNIIGQDSNSLLLDWLPLNDCQQVKTYIEYGPTGFTPGLGSIAGAQGQLIEVTCPPYLLENLPYETAIDLYIRKECTQGAFSNNSCPLNFISGCQIPGPTILEDFDAELICEARCERACELNGSWSNSTDDDFDWIAYQGNTPTLNTGPSEDVSGDGKYLYLEASGIACPNNSQALLLSECFELQKRGLDSCHFSFHYYMSGFNIGALKVEITEDGGATWNKIWEKSGPQGDKWIKTYLSFKDYEDGSIIQVRFTGTKGDGAQGDIALDEISFHGSLPLGKPDNFFYVDFDMDGYGNANQFVATCLNQAPEGFVAIAGDCNDQNPDINPMAIEIPCDLIDNNCNGLEDDQNLPSPIVNNDTICSGETPLIQATSVSGQTIAWFDNPDSRTGFLGFGEFLNISLPPNNTSQIQTHTFYAEETDFVSCFSVERSALVIVVLPRPNGIINEAISICPGDTLDLSSIQIEDINLTGAAIRYYDQYPLTAENELIDTRVLPEGPRNYFYTLTSPEACIFEGNIPVSIKAKPSLNFTPGPTFSLCEGATQLTTVETEGGAAPFTYRWSTGEEDAQILIEADELAGSINSYSVSVTDGGNCVTIDSLQVLTTSSIESVQRSIQNVSQCNGNDGAINIDFDSGVAPFTFSWVGTNGLSGDTTVQSNGPLTIEGLSQGTYRITITDGSANGCFFRMPPVLINGPDANVQAVNVSPVSCFDGDDGAISLSLFGSPNINWSTGATGNSISQLREGYYSVTITEGACETIIDSILVEEPEALKRFFSARSPSCDDGLDGGLNIEVFGGTSPYRYNWSNNAFTSSINGLKADRYYVTVSDLNDCLLVDSFDLEAPTPLLVSLQDSTPINCFSEDNAQLLVEGQGGTPPYKYLWDNGNSSRQLRDLEAGTYTVSITDFRACLTEQSFVLTPPLPLRLEIEELIQPICVGDSSGRIRISATGGRGPYTFIWENGQGANNRENLGVGTYKVLVKDASDCISDTLEISLESVSNLDFQVINTNPTCLGVADGQISIIPNGLGPFSFEWSTGDTSASISQLASGSYALRLIDGQGCLIDTNIVLQPASAPISAIFNIIEPKCANTDDGLININILNADHQPLSYKWNDGPLIRDRQNIRPGTYQVSITDALGCQFISDTLRVKDADPINIELVSEVAIQCKGDTNGFLEVAVDGGQSPYTYRWVGTSSEQPVANNLGAGSYQVFVEDANGCPANAAYNLAEPPAFEAEFIPFFGNICEGDSSNLLRLEAKGGVPPYSFFWSTGSRDSIEQNLPPGDYGAVVSDANRCRSFFPAIKVRDPGAPLNIDTFIVKDISCFGRQDGQMNVTISGGTAPYTYAFSNAQIIKTEQNFASVFNLPIDNDYQVTVLDALGCTVFSEKKALAEPNILSVKRDSIKNISCAGQPDGAVFISPSGGTMPYAYNWIDENGRTVSSLQDLQFAPAGTYTAVVVDANICIDTLAPATIIDNKTPLVTLDTLISHEQCLNTNDGAIRIGVSGGTAPYTYQWNTGSNNSELSNLSPGFYFLTVSDQEACRITIDSLEIFESTSDIQVFEALKQVSCFGEKDGKIEISIDGGHPPYLSSWELNGNILALDTTLLSNLGIGEYGLRITDSIGCTKFFSYTINEPNPIIIALDIEHPQDSSINGQIIASASGGTPPYQYVWNTGADTSFIDSLSADVYIVTVTDANDCINERQIQLVVNAIFDQGIINDINIYPNPGSDRVFLELDATKALAFDLYIFDSNGRKHFQHSSQEAYRHKIELNVHNLDVGIYPIVLRHKNGQILYSGQLIIK